MSTGYSAALGKRLITGVAVAALAVATPVQAQTTQELKDEIAALKGRLDKLEAALAAQSAGRAAPPPAAPAVMAAATPAPASAAIAAVPAAGPKRLALNGDVRVRYESNFGRDAVPNRDRTVFRARVRASYAITPWLTAGGELSTGDANDPKTTDVTLTRFDDDLTVSLSQAYLRGQFGNLTATAGKIPNPFAHTEMVWDNDVYPKGFSATYRADLGGGAAARVNGLYFIIDEAPSAEDSRMIGGQVQFETPSGRPVKLELAGGYYDYRLSSLTGADPLDFRTNRMAGGKYLSDFNLLDVLGAVTFNGMGENWPVRLSGNYVHNYGATTDQDSGYSVDLFVGRGTKPHDLRFSYGYSQTGVDAVLAAFSHDNTDLATNYRQHTFFVDYVVNPGVTFTTTFYRYRQKSLLYTPAFADWANRLRFNLMAAF